MLHFLFWLMAGTAAATTAAVVLSDWDRARERLKPYKLAEGDIATIVKQKRESGEVRYVAKVFAPDKETMRRTVNMHEFELGAEVKDAIDQQGKVEIKL